MTSMTRLLLPLAGVAIFATSCSHRLNSYEDLLHGDPATLAQRAPADELAITYLGVNGYLLQSGDTAILVDPYFSRVTMRDVIFKAEAGSRPEDLAYGITEGAIPHQVDAFLITHSHFDHALDVPALQKQLGGVVIASETGVAICEALGTPRGRLRRSRPGDVHQVGGATIRVLAAHHDLVLGKVPFQGCYEAPPATPLRLDQWLLGTPLAYVIEMGGKRVYLESGGVAGHPPAATDVDLAIIGAAPGDRDGRYEEAVRALNPRFVLPSHQDWFFNPVRSGFHFSPLANFPEIRAIHTVNELPGRLLLMDYFHAWRVP
jgi:L-ascorbate metabolism protein UlaG (beta-lactamase superfamily)